MDMANIMPPPRNTIVECDDLSFGLSMILHLSAILKYTSSATKSSTAIIKYFVHITYYNYYNLNLLITLLTGDIIASSGNSHTSFMFFIMIESVALFVIIFFDNLVSPCPKLPPAIISSSSSWPLFSSTSQTNHSFDMPHASTSTHITASANRFIPS